MPLPSYGAAPLSASFLCTRALQLISMVSIVGITSNFVSLIVSDHLDPPKEVVGTLSVTCIATLYCLVSIAFFWAEANIGLFVLTAIDSLLLIAFVVVAVTLGKPVSFLQCDRLHWENKSSPNLSSYAYAKSLSAHWGHSGSGSGNNFAGWAGATKANCYETKAIWGLGIALCVLFATSASLLPALWFKNKKNRQMDEAMYYTADDGPKNGYA